MIKYRLACAAGHEFEAWFKDSATYDQQAAGDGIACPSCGCLQVEKAIMAPRLARSRLTNEPPATAQGRPPAGDMHDQMLALMRRVRDHVLANADNVGRNFAEEARKIHYEEVPPHGIYGEASADEAEAMREEGIEFLPLPRLPEDRN